MFAKRYEKRYIDESTGAVVNQKTRRVVYLDADKGYLFFLNKNKVVSFEGFDLPDNLTNAEAGMMYRLAKHTHKSSNLISYKSSNTVKPANIVQLSKYLSLSDRRTRIFINKMIRERIIGKVNIKIGNDLVTQYYINPVYFLNGKWLSSNLYFLFQKDLDAFLPSYARDFFQSQKNTENQGQEESAKRAGTPT